ncbi:hypothetical protein Trydic_g21230 [Trypoxylus dichotomus]
MRAETAAHRRREIGHGTVSRTSGHHPSTSLDSTSAGSFEGATESPEDETASSSRGKGTRKKKKKKVNRGIYSV